MERTKTAKNIERVLRFESGMSDCQYSPCFVLKLKRGDCQVFHFPIEQDSPQITLRVENLSENIDQYFNPVTSKIHHRPPTRQRFFDKPVARFAGQWIEHLEGVDLHDH